MTSVVRSSKESELLTYTSRPRSHFRSPALTPTPSELSSSNQSLNLIDEPKNQVFLNDDYSTSKKTDASADHSDSHLNESVIDIALIQLKELQFEIDVKKLKKAAASDLKKTRLQELKFEIKELNKANAKKLRFSEKAAKTKNILRSIRIESQDRQEFVRTNGVNSVSQLSPKLLPPTSPNADNGYIKVMPIEILPGNSSSFGNVIENMKQQFLEDTNNISKSDICSPKSKPKKHIRKNYSSIDGNEMPRKRGRPCRKDKKLILKDTPIVEEEPLFVILSPSNSDISIVNIKPEASLNNTHDFYTGRNLLTKGLREMRKIPGSCSENNSPVKNNVIQSSLLPNSNLNVEKPRESLQKITKEAESNLGSENGVVNRVKIVKTSPCNSENAASYTTLTTSLKNDVKAKNSEQQEKTANQIVPKKIFVNPNKMASNALLNSEASPVKRRLRTSVRCSTLSSAKYKEIMLRKYKHFSQIMFVPRSTKMKSSFNSRVIRELCDALNLLKSDDSVSMVLITSIGSTFCQGVDITSLHHPKLKTRKKNAEILAKSVGELIRALALFPKLLVAGVNGAAIGMGATILPLFDLVYASDKAEFFLPYAHLGQVPEGGATYTFPNLCGRLQSNALFNGRKLNASQAQEFGLVSEVMWADTFHQVLIPKVANLADQSAVSMEATTATKALMNHHVFTKLELSLESECRLLVQQWTSQNFFNLSKKYLDDNNIQMQKPVN